MKRIFIYLLSTCLLSMMSCLDIEEEITINTDGSGMYEVRMDMTEAVKMIMAMAPDSVKEEGMTEDDILQAMADSQGATGEMQAAIDALNEKDGISNASQSLEGGVFTMSYNFRDFTTLTSALKDNGEGGAIDNPFGMTQPVFSGKKGLFSRSQSSEEPAEQDEEMAQAMEMMEMMMGDATYTTIYNFPGKIKKSTNKEASYSNGNKTITVKAKFLDLLDDPSILDNTIKYKKK